MFTRARKTWADKPHVCLPVTSQCVALVATEIRMVGILTFRIQHSKHELYSSAARQLGGEPFYPHKAPCHLPVCSSSTGPVRSVCQTRVCTEKPACPMTTCSTNICNIHCRESAFIVTQSNLFTVAARQNSNPTHSYSLRRVKPKERAFHTGHFFSL